MCLDFQNSNGEGAVRSDFCGEGGLREQFCGSQAGNTVSHSRQQSWAVCLNRGRRRFLAFNTSVRGFSVVVF